MLRLVLYTIELHLLCVYLYCMWLHETLWATYYTILLCGGPPVLNNYNDRSNHTNTIPKPYQHHTNTISKPYQHHTKTYEYHTKPYQNHTTTIQKSTPTPYQNHTKTIRPSTCNRRHFGLERPLYNHPLTPKQDQLHIAHTTPARRQSKSPIQPLRLCANNRFPFLAGMHIRTCCWTCFVNNHL